jgi:hypothetical protein
MRRLLLRWLAYLFIPAGLVLFLVPMSTHRLEEAEKDVLFLENREDLVASEKPMTEEPPLGEPESLDEAVQRMNERRAQAALDDARAEEIINPYGYPRIASEDWASYPALFDAVRTLQFIWAYIPRRWHEEDAVPLEEWYAFCTAAGLSAEDAGFQDGRYVYRGEVRGVGIVVPVEVTYLKAGYKVAGALLLLLGLAALWRAYAPQPQEGIRIGRRSAVIIWDVCIMGVGAVFTWWFLEWALSSAFGTSTEWVEEFSVGMGVFWVALVNPVLALVTTSMSAQALSISRDSITLSGLLGRSTVRWNELESLRVSQTHSLRRMGGVDASHRVMKTLVIAGGGKALHVMEPPYVATKKEILGTLLDHAPDEHKPRVEAASKEWLSRW